jgi:hypothetical protein
MSAAAEAAQAGPSNMSGDAEVVRPVNRPRQKASEGFKKTQADSERGVVHNYSVRVCYDFCIICSYIFI